MKQGVEIPGKENEHPLIRRCLDPGIYGRDYRISFRHGQGSTRAEVVLNIYNKQCIMGSKYLIWLHKI